MPFEVRQAPKVWKGKGRKKIQEEDMELDNVNETDKGPKRPVSSEEMHVDKEALHEH